MTFLRPQDALPKSYLNRLLMEIIDRPALAHRLAFKGGSCAAMLGYLDRFSIDLDFDVLKDADESSLRPEFHRAFDRLGLKIAYEAPDALFFQLLYSGAPGKPNWIEVNAGRLPEKNNQYKVQYFVEIDRLMNCQTLETMVANKLVALTDRYTLHHTIAGRDVYDIHYFLRHGYGYHAAIITERTGLSAKAYLEKLARFIQENVTPTILQEDLSALLPQRQFQQIRKILIPETISLIGKEIEKLSH